MSPCLLLYGLAALVGGTLGGPAGRVAAAVLVAAVLVRHVLAHPPPTRRAVARR